MNWLWTTEDMIAAMAGRPFGSLPQGITGISIDSRSIALHTAAGLAIASWVSVPVTTPWSPSARKSGRSA